MPTGTRGGSYNTAMGTTWRSLQAITQRSYMVVAVKKAETQSKSRPSRRLSPTEAHMSLINHVFELLASVFSGAIKYSADLDKWAAASGYEESGSLAGPSSERRSPTNARLSLVNQMERSVASAVAQPSSSRMHCFARTEGTRSPRVGIDPPPSQSSPRSPSRSPVSPLARYPPLTASENSDETETDSVGLRSYFVCSEEPVVPSEEFFE